MNENGHPLPTVLTTHIIETPAALLRQLMAGLGSRGDHRPELEQLLKAVPSDSVRAIATSRIEANAGSRADDQSGVQHSYLSDVALNGKGGASTSIETRLVGLRSEVEVMPRASEVRSVQLTHATEFHTDAPWCRSSRRTGGGRISH